MLSVNLKVMTIRVKSTRDYAKFFDPSGLLMYYKDSKKLRPLFYPRNKIHGPIYFKAKNTTNGIVTNDIKVDTTIVLAILSTTFFGEYIEPTR